MTSDIYTHETRGFNVDAMTRIERSLAQALALARGTDAPPSLISAMRYSVFPGGARIRPRLCLAVARACAEDRASLSAAAAAAIELLHCASLVHDDLPCFDDATMRRGKPSVHRAFGEPVAVLAGDAMIVMSFELVARAACAAPSRLAPIVTMLARAAGTPHGLVAGQAWESEKQVPLEEYQRAKTGSLFMAATMLGAIAAGADPAPWRAMGERLGEAYQVADDIRDATCSAVELGKPVGQDVAHGRPNAVLQLGLDGAIAWLEELAGRAVDSVPPCPGQNDLRSHILSETMRLLPAELARHAA